MSGILGQYIGMLVVCAVGYLVLSIIIRHD